MSVAEQVIALIAATKGAFDHLTNHDVESAVHRVIAAVKKSHAKLYASLDEGIKPEDSDIDAVVKEAEAVAKTFGTEKARK
jgi:F0F1-type ATP synthase alpha subunit